MAGTIGTFRRKTKVRTHAFATIATLVLSMAGMLIPRIAEADEIVLTPLPATSQSGLAGNIVGWGYTITNNTADYYQPFTLDISPLADDVPTILFDYPLVAPDSTVTEDFAFATSGDIGLLEIQLEGSANTVDSGTLTMGGEFYADPNYNTDLGAAPNVYAEVTAETTSSVVPEPNLMPAMVLALAGLALYLRLRRGNRPARSAIRASIGPSLRSARTI